MSLDKRADTSSGVSVYLSGNEVELFKKFREHQDLFQFMADSGVLEMKRGAATLNFDENGIINSIKTERWNYKNKKQKA